MGFRLVQKLVTLNDLERRNSPNLRVISPKYGSFEDGLRESSLRYIDTFCGKIVGQSIQFLVIYHLAILAGDHP